MKRGKFWKYFLALLLAFSLSLPLFSESATELTVPDLEPEAEYVMTGQDIMTLYQTINDLNETKTEYKNLTTEMMGILTDVQTFCHEYEKENKKLRISNKVLFGGITVSVGVAVTGVIVWACSTGLR